MRHTCRVPYILRRYYGQFLYPAEGIRYKTVFDSHSNTSLTCKVITVSKRWYS